MKRMYKEEIEFIIKLIHQGKSLNKISKITGKSKSTIYYYYNKINGITIKKISLKNLDNEFLGEFLGIFAGDGNFYFNKKGYKYLIRLFFNSKEEKYAKEIKEILSKSFLKEPNLRKEKNQNLITVEYRSKILINFIKKYLKWDPTKKKGESVCLIKSQFPKNFKIGFIRGSLDSDGHLSENKISFASISEKLIENIEIFLQELGFKNFHKSSYLDKRGNRKRMYYININKPDRENFLELIQPRNKNF